MARGFNSVFGVIVVGLLSLFLITFTGCAKKSVTTAQSQQGIATEEIGGSEGAGVEEGAAGEEGLEESELLAGGKAHRGGEEEEISEGRTSAPLLPIYFDFDKYNIRGDMISRMEHNARYLLQHPEVKIQIQGNCDERGTNEYNIALGEKRAKSAKDFLVNMGIDPSRIDTVSFGEERPLDPGHNEEAWAKNRRDDFVIISR